jgi:hypothetical protein
MPARRIALVPSLVLALLVLFAPHRAAAGPYGDALAKCIVDSTTRAEKTAFVRYIFAVIALHPDVQGGSNITPAQRSAMAKQAAQLIQRLLTDACATETKDALHYEGMATIQSSFSLLGQVAARELFTHPKVTEGMAEMAKYIDESKFKALAPKDE